MKKLTESLRTHGIVPEDNPGLISSLIPARERGWLNRDEFIKVCRVKSPRAAPRFERNNEKDIQEITRLAFRTENDRARMGLLTSLEGVGVATASFLLSMVHPDRFGTIDIRVWQMFHRIGTVSTKPGGTGFVVEDWLVYLPILREAARILKTTPRCIELSLFFHHRSSQRGPLYGTKER